MIFDAGLSFNIGALFPDTIVLSTGIGPSLSVSALFPDAVTLFFCICALFFGINALLFGASALALSADVSFPGIFPSVCALFSASSPLLSTLSIFFYIS